MYNSLIAGVDIGGSHITVALIDPDHRGILNGTIKRSRIDSGTDAETILTGWCKVIEESYSAINARPVRLGIAMPGPFDYAEGISLMKDQNKYNSLYGINVKDWLGVHLNVKKENIVFNNDASCFLQGEVYSGAAKGKQRVMGLTLGTGLGSSWFTAENAVDADMWHHPFKDGIAEDYLSSRWFTRRYSQLTGTVISDVKQLVDRYLTTKDKTTEQIFNEFGTNLAEFLIPLLISENIHDVVLGGNISQAFDLFSGSLNSKIKSKGIIADIRQTILWENAALLGAASYCSNVTDSSEHLQVSRNIS